MKYLHTSPSLAASGLVIGLMLSVSPIAPSVATAAPLAVTVSDVAGYPGQRILVPIWISADVDTVAGFQISYNLDRPNVAAFVVDTLPDTLIVCVDPPECTVMDTTIDNVPRVVLDASGSLCEGWDFLAGTNPDGQALLRLTGLADLTGQRQGVILPFENGILLRVAMDIDCHPDPLAGNKVLWQPNAPFTQFSDAVGNLIEPFTMGGATITVLDFVMCDLDYSGFPDAVDLSAFIQCLFFNDCPDCDAVPLDYDCSGQPDAVDLNVMIDYLFFSGPEPVCP